MSANIKRVQDILSESALSKIRAPIQRAETFPNAAFTDPDFFNFEVEYLLKKTWSAVDFSGRISNAGDVQPITLYGCPILLVRNEHGRLNAFHNVSPYDGCEIALEEQTGLSNIETPYHGWIYDLDGKLLNASFFDGSPNPSAQPENVDLVALPCAEWMGTVFVSVDPGVEPFDDYLAPVLENLGNIDFSDLHVGRDPNGNVMIDELPIKSNWKTVFENYSPNVYHENFVHKMYRRSDHVPRVDHQRNKQYEEIVDPHGFIGLSYDNSIGASFYPSNPFPPITTQDGEVSQRNTIANMYPNWVITVLNQYMRMTVFLPISADTCTQSIATLYRGESATDPELVEARVVAARGGAVAREEDNAICESIQRARSSPAFDRHFYSPFWDRPHYTLTNFIANKLVEALSEICVS